MVLFDGRFTAYSSARRAFRLHAAIGWLCAHSRVRAVIVIFLLFFCGASKLALAQDMPVSAMEYPVKAAFLYKFCLYIQWPPAAFASADSPFIFGIAAPDEFIAELNAVVADRTINGRRIQIRRIDNDDASGVHLLFVAHSNRFDLPKLIAQTRGQPVIIVTESERGLDDGGTINFALKNNRVSFEVALDAANRQGLHLSAQLLKVASSVRGEATP